MPLQEGGDPEGAQGAGGARVSVGRRAVQAPAKRRGGGGKLTTPTPSPTLQQLQHTPACCRKEAGHQVGGHGAHDEAGSRPHKGLRGRGGDSSAAARQHLPLGGCAQAHVGQTTTSKTQLERFERDQSRVGAQALGGGRATQAGGAGAANGRLHGGDRSAHGCWGAVCERGRRVGCVPLVLGRGRESAGWATVVGGCGACLTGQPGGPGRDD